MKHFLGDKKIKSLIIWHKSFFGSGSEKKVIRPSDCRNSKLVEVVRRLYVKTGFLFKDSALSEPFPLSEFNAWVDKCLKSFSKREKARAVKYAPCEIIIKALLSKVHNYDEFNEWRLSNGVSDCFRFCVGLHRGYAVIDERGILQPLRTQTGYGFWYKEYHSSFDYWYNRIIIDLEKVDRLLQVLS